MPKLIFIKDKAEIQNDSSWVQTRWFEDKEQIISHEGRAYQIIQKYSRSFSFFERLGRVLLGVLLIIGALFSKYVRNLLIKKETSNTYAILLEMPTKQTASIDAIKNDYKADLKRNEFSLEDNQRFFNEKTKDLPKSVFDNLSELEFYPYYTDFEKHNNEVTIKNWMRIIQKTMSYPIMKAFCSPHKKSRTNACILINTGNDLIICKKNPFNHWVLISCSGKSSSYIKDNQYVDDKFLKSEKFLSFKRYINKKCLSKSH